MLPPHRILVLTAIALALSSVLVVAPPARAAAKKAEKPESEPFGRFTVDQVERRLGQPGVYVFDGNPSEIYAENHLPAAARLNHKDITKDVLPKDSDATLIFYCMNEL